MEDSGGYIPGNWDVTMKENIFDSFDNEK